MGRGNGLPRLGAYAVVAWATAIPTGRRLRPFAEVRRRAGSSLTRQEIEDRGVGLVGECPADVVRTVLDLDDREVGDQLLIA